MCVCVCFTRNKVTIVRYMVKITEKKKIAIVSYNIIMILKVIIVTFIIRVAIMRINVAVMKKIGHILLKTVTIVR